MRRAASPVLCFLFLPPAWAQKDIPAAELKLSAEETLVETRWGFDAQKGLLLWPNPLRGGDTGELTPFFTGDPIEGPWQYFLTNSGPAGFLSLVLFGEEDLVSHCFADYHFRRAGLERNEQALRMRIAVPNQGRTAFQRRLNALHRILAVRIAQRRGLRSAIPELRVVSEDKNTDDLLRWAAQDALATLTGEPVSAAKRVSRHASLDETLAAVPDQFHAILSVDHSRLPWAREIPWLGRRMILHVNLQDIHAAGGTISPDQRAGAQVMADAVSLSLFELARNVGNFRVGRITATVFAGRGRTEPDTWVRIDGRFEPTPLLKLLAKNGHEVEGDTATMPTHRIRVTKRLITFHTADYPLDKKGGKAARLKQLGLDDENQLFVHLAKMQRLTMMTGAPLTQVDGALFLGRLSTDRKLTMEARCKNAAQARGLFNLIETGMAKAREFLKDPKGNFGQLDPQKYEKLFFPSFDREDESAVITMNWDAGKLTYANILEATMGIENAVSAQDGPVKTGK